MISGGDKNCRVGAASYGGLGLSSLFYAKAARKSAEACAAELTKKTGQPHTVETVVRNGGDGLPAYVRELWYEVVQGKAHR